VLVLDVTQAAAEAPRLIPEACDLNVPLSRGQGRAKRARALGGSSRGGVAITEPQNLANMVPVGVLTEVKTAIALLELLGPAILKRCGCSTGRPRWCGRR